MQVHLHSGAHTDGRQPMAEHLGSAMQHALGRFGDRVTRVEAHLSDADGAATSGPGGIHCTLQAHLVGAAAVVVKAEAANAHQAVEDATRKLKRAVGAVLERHDPRRPAKPRGAAVAERVEGASG